MVYETKPNSHQVMEGCYCIVDPLGQFNLCDAEDNTEQKMKITFEEKIKSIVINVLNTTAAATGTTSSLNPTAAQPIPPTSECIERDRTGHSSAQHMPPYDMSTPTTADEVPLFHPPLFDAQYELHYIVVAHPVKL